MGIAKGAVSLLFELKRTTELGGAICQLGRQQIFVTGEQLQDIAGRFGFTVKASGRLDDEQVFKALGFDCVESVDYSDYEKPTRTLDLNEPVPLPLYGRYDAIFDGGTMEHVFNLPMVLRNIHAMLKPGGLVIHGSPSHNHVDHGFYMFSPTLFNDYYRANQYELLRIYLFEYEKEHDTKPWLVYEYTPAAIANLKHGGWGEKLLGIWCVARKTEHSTCDIVPQQGTYMVLWEKHNRADATTTQPSLTTWQTIKHMVASNRLLGPSMRFLLGKRSNGRPPVIARY